VGPDDRMKVPADIHARSREHGRASGFGIIDAVWRGGRWLIKHLINCCTEFQHRTGIIRPGFEPKSDHFIIRAK